MAKIRCNERLLIDYCLDRFLVDVLGLFITSLRTRSIFSLEQAERGLPICDLSDLDPVRSKFTANRRIVFADRTRRLSNFSDILALLRQSTNYLDLEFSRCRPINNEFSVSTLQLIKKLTDVNCKRNSSNIS